MSPVSGRNSGHEIRDSRSVLRNAHTVAARRARVAVGHMNRALLVSDRHERDARGREDIERVHERRTDDPKYVGDTIRGERFNECLRGPHLLRLGHRLAPVPEVSSDKIVCLCKAKHITIPGEQGKIDFFVTSVVSRLPEWMT